MKILLASSNHHKARELNEIITSHKIILPSDIGIDFDFPETGDTFLENAVGKAKALYSMVRIPVIAEDSGLCVGALGGEPGIYSARYGSDGTNKLSDSERNSFLLEKMKGITDRSAFYVCSMVLVLECNRFFVCQETTEGEITEEPMGSGGFGYDPVFLVRGKGKTAAQLSPDEKNKVSHRGKAGAVMADIILKVLDNDSLQAGGTG